METVKNQFIKTTTSTQIWKLLKISVILRPPHQSKVETVKNQFFQDHHIHPNMETVKNLFFHDHHIQPNIETVKNQLFQDHPSNQI